MIALDAGLLLGISPRHKGPKAIAQKRIVAALAKTAAPTLKRYRIDNPLRIAHFLAQACHETDGFCTTNEYWGPTLAQSRYEGRRDLGNSRSGDGYRYRGRGIFQLTGRANYQKMSARLGLDLVGTPALAADPAVSLAIACEYWVLRKINALADLDDLPAVTRKINGGTNGLADRRACLAKARAALDAMDLKW